MCNGKCPFLMFQSIYVYGTRNLLILYVTCLGIFGNVFFKKTAQPTYTKTTIKIFSKDTETSREGNEWTFHVNDRSLSKNFGFF